MFTQQVKDELGPKEEREPSPGGGPQQVTVGRSGGRDGVNNTVGESSVPPLIGGRFTSTRFPTATQMTKSLRGPGCPVSLRRLPLFAQTASLPHL